MEPKELIESGLLELFVAGVLSEKENADIQQSMRDYPEVREEVLRIEAAVIQLTASVAVPSRTGFTPIASDIIDSGESPVVKMEPGKRTNWIAYTGWAAAILLAVGMLWMFNLNKELREARSAAEKEVTMLEDRIAAANKVLEQKNELLAILRDRDILSVPLEGQAASPSSFARVYWDRQNENIYLDVLGLPDPPEGKVYQVWSLTLDPLTPTSLGILTAFVEDANRVFTLENPNASEAFGITLEPEGGSESPTLEQLYALGTVSS